MTPLSRFVLILCLLLGVAAAANAQDFPAPFNHGEGADSSPLDPEQAAAGFRLPPGFRAQLFAAEPEVQNPVAMTWDTRGRLWVAECYTYADRPTRYDLALRDRVLIFADKDGDGRADERKIFCDNVQRLVSVEVGLGGVWLISLPRVLFIPDRDANDIPDGPPEVVLDGFGLNPDNYHNCANGLKWGPDGWLYGRCGASGPGYIGPPGAPEADRVPIFGGLWRYHPARKVFETLCHGTTNPWGHDWDAHGELFFTNTVTGHLFHVFPGAHYTRSSTLSVNRRVYEPIDSHADHFHWDVGRGTSYKEVAHDQLGGGHAHCGAMIYLADQWPPEYRGKLLTINLHGRRLNVDRLERHGSGYVGRHDPDMAFAQDAWFRGIDLTYGPDGSVYVIDWSDTGDCHEHSGIHRLSGRIFRFSYGPQQQPPLADLTNLPLADLAKLHTHTSEWFVRMARRELANRAGAGQDVQPAAAELGRIFTKSDDNIVPKLRALWTLYTLGAIDRNSILALLDHADEHVRVWGLRLATDFWPLDSVHGVVRSTPDAIDPNLLPRLETMATTDSSGLVRLTLTSTIQRLPLALRPGLAAHLSAHLNDAKDHNLPKLMWYSLAPLLENDPHKLVPLAARGKFPLTREWISRALAEDIIKNPSNIEELLRETTSLSEAVRSDILRGLAAGLAGRRKVEPPLTWPNYAATLESAAPEVRELVRNLSVVFGDGRALDEVRQLTLDTRANLSERQAALEALIEARPDDLREICEKVLRVRFLNTTALKGLTRFDDAALGEQLAKSYNNFHPSERAAVIEALVARPAFARGLLDQVEAGRIPATEISALQARQIRSFGDDELTARLSQVWGELRDSPQDKQLLMDSLKRQLTRENLAAADLSRGRVVFQTACANCHRLYGTGGAIAPDLTGSGRHNLDYLLSNIVDPSATVNKDYRMSVVRHADGRILNGLITSQDDQRVVLQTAQERLTIPREEIDEIKPTTLSPMPEGMLQPLTPEQIRDLIAYLMSAGQVNFPPDFQPPSSAQP
jgi:putative membrane-bound dehydrogenase-like protein